LAHTIKLPDLFYLYAYIDISYCTEPFDSCFEWSDLWEEYTYDDVTGGRFQENVVPSAYKGPRQHTIYFPEFPPHRPSTFAAHYSCRAILLDEKALPTAFEYLLYDGDRLIANHTGVLGQGEYVELDYTRSSQ
jgi:hypothetical protein